MQKKLTALAALAAASLSSAFAADITTYGVINTGLSYTRADTSVSETTDTFEMDTGNYLGSRFGLKGSEEINDRLTVGFVLENGFSSDTARSATAADSSAAKRAFGCGTTFSGRSVSGASPR